MRRNWQVTYWILMALSGLWLVLSSAASTGLLFKILMGYERFEVHSTVELVIAGIVGIQPLLIGWLIKRAHKMRMIGSTVSMIGRAALPMSTIVLLLTGYAANNYYKNLISEEIDWQRRNRTITYDCSRYSQDVDHDPKKIADIGLRLTSIRRGQEPEKWLVIWPGQAPISAARF